MEPSIHPPIDLWGYRHSLAKTALLCCLCSAGHSHQSLTFHCKSRINDSDTSILSGSFSSVFVILSNTVWPRWDDLQLTKRAKSRTSLYKSFSLAQPFKNQNLWMCPLRSYKIWSFPALNKYTVICHKLDYFMLHGYGLFSLHRLARTLGHCKLTEFKALLNSESP